MHQQNKQKWIKFNEHQNCFTIISNRSIMRLHFRSSCLCRLARFWNRAFASLRNSFLMSFLSIYVRMKKKLIQLIKLECFPCSFQESVMDSPAFSIITSFFESHTVVKYSTSAGCEVTGVAHPIKAHWPCDKFSPIQATLCHMCPHKIPDCSSWWYK